MTITAILGKPGSGKTYEAVFNHIVPALEKGREVITNIPLQRDRLEMEYPGLRLSVLAPVQGGALPFGHISHYPSGEAMEEREPGDAPLLVIDEAHEVLTFRKGVEDRDGLIRIENWFAMHRHLGVNVIILTQALGSINKAIAQRIETYVHLRTNKMFFGRRSLSYRRLVSTAPSPQSGDKMQVRRLDPGNFRKGYYASDVWGGGGEQAYFEDVSNFFRRPVFYFFGLVLIAIIVMLSMYGLPFFGLFAEAKTTPPALSGASPAISTAAGVVPAAGPPAAPGPRLVAEVKRAGRTVAFFAGLDPAEVGSILTAEDLRARGWIVNRDARGDYHLRRPGAQDSLRVPRRR